MMPWFPRDWIAATRHLAPAERGAYRELLDFQWELGVLPADTTRLARLIGYPQEMFDEAWPAIRDKFVDTDGGLVNKRLEEHRNKSIGLTESRRRGAEIANAKRGAKRDANRDANRDAERDAECSTGRTAKRAHPSPSPSNKEEEGAQPAGAPTAPHLIPDDWRPDEANRQWLEEAGLKPTEQKMLADEFRLWAKHAGIRRKNWQLTFSRNPKVKFAIGRARSNGQQGAEDRLEKHQKEIRKLAEMFGIEQGDRSWDEFESDVTQRNNARIAGLGRQAATTRS